MSATCFGPSMPLSMRTTEKFLTMAPNEKKYIGDIIKGSLVVPYLVYILGYKSMNG
jgi:hypothetical protein